MAVIYHPAARAELRRTARRYERERRGLGQRFLVAVKTAEAVISADPAIGKSIRGAARQHIVRGFPYRIIYRVDAAIVNVLAVAHDRRRPEYWIGRANP